MHERRCMTCARFKPETRKLKGLLQMRAGECPLKRNNQPLIWNDVSLIEDVGCASYVMTKKEKKNEMDKNC